MDQFYMVDVGYGWLSMCNTKTMHKYYDDAIENGYGNESTYEDWLADMMRQGLVVEMA